MLGDFIGKKMQNWEETKCGVQQIITIICVTYVQKNF